MLQFSRTIPSETSKGPVLIALFGHMNWIKVSMMTSTNNVWIQSGLGLTKQLKAAAITVQTPAAFEPNNFQDARLGKIRRSGFRITILIANNKDVVDVASAAHRQEMNSAGWAWILVDRLLGAPREVMGWMALMPLLPSRDMQAFVKRVSEYSKSHFNFAVSADSVDLTFSTALHDAVMLYAHAATKVLAEGGDLGNGSAVTEAVRSITIQGVGNDPVTLNSQGDRIMSYEVVNYVQGENGGMHSVAIAMYNSSCMKYTVQERQVVWPGRTTVVPLDYVKEVCDFASSAAYKYRYVLSGVCSVRFVGVKKWAGMSHL